LGLLLGVVCALVLQVVPAAAATPIEQRYAALGGSGSRLGAPVGGEVCGLTQSGCYRKYRGGHIHWTSATGAQPTWGAIMDRWAATGWERGVLGYPTMGEACGLTGSGCYQHFQAGSIHWSPASGAHWTRGMIRNRWSATGWERGVLGYPLTDENCGLVRGGCHQTFQGGSIHW